MWFTLLKIRIFLRLVDLVQDLQRFSKSIRPGRTASPEVAEAL